MRLYLRVAHRQSAFVQVTSEDGLQKPLWRRLYSPAEHDRSGRIPVFGVLFCFPDRDDRASPLLFFGMTRASEVPGSCIPTPRAPEIPMRRAMKGIVTLAVFLTIAAPAAAASIHGNLLSFVAGPDNSPANGGGTLEDVFGAAALYWELALLDNVDVVID